MDIIEVSFAGYDGFFSDFALCLCQADDSDEEALEMEFVVRQEKRRGGGGRLKIGFLSELSSDGRVHVFVSLKVMVCAGMPCQDVLRRGS